MASSSRSKSEMKPVSLTAPILASFRPARVIPSPTAHEKLQSLSSSLSFTDDGNFLAIASEDGEAFHVMDCQTGELKTRAYSQKYGVGLVRYTHGRSTVLHSSTKGDDAIRYYSSHDSKYLAYFKGHTDRVISLEMCPADDGFISSSLDNTVRLWDLRMEGCRGLLHVQHSPVVAYDNMGMVFAVAQNGFNAIHLYASQSFDQAPFMTIPFVDDRLAEISYPPRIPIITSLSFSSNGRFLLVGTSSDVHYVLDAFQGHIVRRLEGSVGLEKDDKGKAGVEPIRGKSGEEVCWSSDSKFVLAGSNDGHVVCWDLTNSDGHPQGVPPLTLRPISKVEGHAGAVRAIKFNPKYLQFGSGGLGTGCIWLQGKDSKMKDEEN